MSVLQQPVRADDDVHRAGGQVLDHAFLLARAVRKRESSSTRIG